MKIKTANVLNIVDNFGRRYHISTGTTIYFQILDGEDNTIKPVKAVIESIDSDGNMIVIDGENTYKCEWKTLVRNGDYEIDGCEDIKSIVLDNGKSIMLNDTVMMIDKEKQFCVSIYKIDSICGNVVAVKNLVDNVYSQINVDEYDESKYDLVPPIIPLQMYKDIMNICSECVLLYPVYELVMTKNGNKKLFGIGDQILAESTVYGIDMESYLTIQEIGFIEGRGVIRFKESHTYIPLDNIEKSMECELSINLKEYHISYTPDYEKYDYLYKDYKIRGYMIEKDIALKVGANYVVTDLDTRYLFNGTLNKVEITYNALALTFLLFNINKEVTIMVDTENPNYYIFDNATIETLGDDEDDFE